MVGPVARAKKSRGGPRLSSRKDPGRSELRSGEDANVRGLQALLALLHFELHALVLSERLEAVALDVAEVGEEVGAARVLRDEAEALALVEPLHGSGLGRHKKYPVYDEMNAQQHAARAATLKNRSRGISGGPPRGPRG